MGRFLHGFDKIRSDDVFAAVHFKVVLETAIKGVFTKLVAKHGKNPAALGVSITIKLAGIVEVVADDRLVEKIALAEPLARAFPAFIIGLILAVMSLRPHILHKRREALVEPDVAPIFAGDEVPEPLVAEFVGDEAVLIGVEFGGNLGMIERATGVGGGAGIFHASSDEVIHHDLRVFFPGVVDAELFAEEINHGGSAAVVDGETIAAAFRDVVSDRHAAPGILCFIELTGNYRDEIGRTGNGFAPSPGL